MTPPLGPLEFKAEDFLPDGCVIGHRNDCQLFTFLERANRLLAERLEKAPEIKGEWYLPGGERPGIFTQVAEPHPYCSHRARLVCIEEIKK